MTGPLSDQHLDEIAALLARLDAVPSMGHLDSADLGWVRPVLHDLLDENRRLRDENEQLADLDAAAGRRTELQAERDRAVQRWHEEHQRAEQAVAERNAIARQIADRTDERDTAETERVRLAIELGALDAQRAEDRVAYEDLQAAYDRLGEQTQRIIESASRFRAERDRLHDALNEVLASGGPEFDGEVLRGLRRTLWITPERLQGWRQVLAETPRSESDDGTAP